MIDEGIVKKIKRNESCLMPNPLLSTPLMLPLAACIIIFAGLCTLGPSPSAQTEMPWQYQAKTKLKTGEKAEFVFVPKTDLQSARIRVFSEAGQVIETWQGTLIDAGESRTMRWPVTEGQSTWRIEVEVGQSDGLMQATVTLQVVVATPLDVTLAKEDIDFFAGQVTVKTNKPLTSVELRFVTEKQSETQKTQLKPSGKAGKWVLSLPDIGDDRFRLLRLKFRDDSSQWVSIDVVNWYARIPHDDVVFSSGSAEISVEERQKLLDVITKIKKEQRAFASAVGRADAALDLELYVAGMTDTVGSNADNLKLSADRARAIAEAFREENLKCPIYSGGFGESRLKVQTADGVPEARNRRALYILTNHRPRDLVPPSGRWRLSR